MAMEPIGGVIRKAADMPISYIGGVIKKKLLYMNDGLLEVFKLISKMKEVDIVEIRKKMEEDKMFYLKAYYPKISKIISFKKWKSIVENYSSQTGEGIFESCRLLQFFIYIKLKDRTWLQRQKKYILS